MKHLKTFESYNQQLILEFVNPNQKSAFLPNLTFADLANKFKKTPEYISEFEEYLKMASENNPHVFGLNNELSKEEEYQFHLEENYPEYLGDDEIVSHGHDL